jgi:ubiquinone biosynthesis accessory factor UbiJ
MFIQPSAAALNHLIEQNSWALTRLARYAGKTARFDIAPFSFSWTVQHDGTLRAAEGSSAADARCIIDPSLLPRLVLHDEKAHAGIRTEGDAGFLKEIFFLSRNLRWDAAEDLSRVTGDIAAERIVQAVQNIHLQIREAAINFTRAAAEFITEERPLLAKSRHISVFLQQVDVLRDDVARLEQRITRLLAG